jgi:hypothetical protein
MTKASAQKANREIFIEKKEPQLQEHLCSSLFLVPCVAIGLSFAG